MRLKTAKDATDATDACQEQLIRGGFEADKYSSWWLKMRLGGDKPGVIYEAWFSSGYHGDFFVAINKGTAGSKDNGDWDFSNRIILILV